MALRLRPLQRPDPVRPQSRPRAMRVCHEPARPHRGDHVPCVPRSVPGGGGVRGCGGITSGRACGMGWWCRMRVGRGGGEGMEGGKEGGGDSLSWWSTGSFAMRGRWRGGSWGRWSCLGFRRLDPTQCDWGGGELIAYQSLLQSGYSVTMYATLQDPRPSASKMCSQRTTHPESSNDESTLRFPPFPAPHAVAPIPCTCHICDGKSLSKHQSQGSNGRGFRPRSQAHSTALEASGRARVMRK